MLDFTKLNHKGKGMICLLHANIWIFVLKMPINITEYIERGPKVNLVKIKF